MTLDLTQEATRNQVLRRADWRFLLPVARVTQSVCFADGLLAQAVSAISDRLVAPALDIVAQCDLAVAVEPDRATEQAAWSALRPGGWYYSERYALRAGSAAHLRQRLQQTGYADVRCYWPWPWPERSPAQFWLPLAAPHLVAYFLQQRALIGGRRQRAAFALRRIAWRAIDRVGLQRPICVVARKPGPALDVEIERGLEATFDRLLLTGGRHSQNKVVALVAAEHDGAPRAAVKMARVPEANAALHHEASILQAVQQRRPNLAGVPRVLFCREQDAALMLGESVLGGAPLDTRLHRENYRDLALAATTWLSALAGQVSPAPRTVWWSRLVEAPLAEFEAGFGMIVDRVQLERTRACLAQLTDLPLVCEQRDFSPWNVLIDAAGHWVVLDWESAEADGLPLCDLIYFLAYLTFFRDGAMESGRYRKSYRDLLNPQTTSGAIFAECQQRYAAQVLIDAAVFKPLRLLTWLLHARSEYRRLMASSSALQHSLFVGLWAEELAQCA